MSVPERLGHVVETWQPTDTIPKGLVIHLQDLHTHPDAQQHLSELIGYLHEQFGIELVALEGAEGLCDTTIYSDFPDSPSTEKIARLFLKEGLFTGAEYYAITHPGTVRLWGVEDESLYLEHLAIYQQGATRRDDADATLTQLRSAALTPLKARLYPRPLQQLLKLREAYEQGEKDGTFSAYFTELRRLAKSTKLDLAGSPHVEAMAKALKLHDQLDMRQVEAESRQLLETLWPQLSSQERAQLNQLANALAAKQISALAYYETLDRAAKAHTVLRPRAFRRYLRYERLSQKTQSRAFIEEFEALEEAVEQALLSTEQPRTLAKLLKLTDLMEGLIHIKLSPATYRQYQQRRGALTADTLWDDLQRVANHDPRSTVSESSITQPELEQLIAALPTQERFYDLAITRDEALVRNTLKLLDSRVTSHQSPVTVLITGGFHTPGLTARFKEQNLAYVVITPKVDEEFNESQYQGLLSSQFPDLGTLWRGVQTMLLPGVLAEKAPVMLHMLVEGTQEPASGKSKQEEPVQLFSRDAKVLLFFALDLGLLVAAGMQAPEAWEAIVQAVPRITDYVQPSAEGGQLIWQAVSAPVVMRITTDGPQLASRQPGVPSVTPTAVVQATKATVWIPAPLRRYTANRDLVEVTATTVSEALEQLASQYTGLKDRLYTAEGKLNRFLHVYLKDEDVADQPNRTLTSSDELQLVFAIAGGSDDEPTTNRSAESSSRIPRLGVGEVAVSASGLAPLFIGKADTLRDHFREVLGDPPAVAVSQWLGEGEDAVEVFTRMTGTRIVWAFQRTDAVRIARVLGFTLRGTEPPPPLGIGEVAGSPAGLAALFVGQPTMLRRRLLNVLGDPPPTVMSQWLGEGEDAVEVFTRISGRKIVWAFRQTDAVQVARYFSVTLRGETLTLRGETPPPLAVGEIDTSNLASLFVGDPGDLRDRFRQVFGDPPPTATTKRLGEGDNAVEVFTRTSKNFKIVWAFRRTDAVRIARVLGFTLRGTEPPLPLAENEVAASPAGLSAVFIGQGTMLAGRFREVFGDPPAEAVTKRLGEGEDAVEVFTRTSGTHIIWAFLREDAERLALIMDWELRQEGSERLENLGLIDAIALLGGDPLRLHQYIRIYHPELSVEQAEQLTVTALRGLQADWSEAQLAPHASFAVTLSPPTVVVEATATAAASVSIIGRVMEGVQFIQITGAYSRRIVVKNDGTFSATLPLPKIGEANTFEFYAVDPEHQQRSLSTIITVRQTGVKPDTEEAFLRLLAMRGNLLTQIQENPARYQFLLRSVEQSLLRHFTYDETQGLAYLRQRIAGEDSPALRQLLGAILPKFEAMAAMPVALKPGQRLYFYQKYLLQEVKALMEQGAPGVILAMEQGLGKTVVALMLVDGRPALILTPNAVIGTWEEQSAKFLPQSTLASLEGAYVEREAQLASLTKPHVLTNIEFTRGMTAARARLLAKPDGVLVVDEADYLGTRASQQAQGTREIQAGFHLLLTATPFKRPGQIPYLLDIFANDSSLKSSRAFTRAFDVTSPRDLKALFLLMQRYTLRVRKRDVFEEYDPAVPLSQQSDRLPKKVEIPLSEGEFTLTDVQARSILQLFTDYVGWCRLHRGRETPEDEQYFRFREGYFSKREALRQIMNDPRYIGHPGIPSPKHQAMDRIVEKELAADSTRKLVIFARYRAQVETYLTRYARYGARAYYGGLPSNKDGYKVDGDGNVFYYAYDEYDNIRLDARGKPIPTDKAHGHPIRVLDYERLLFQNDPESRILVATYDAGSVGVTLTAADAVIFDDLAQTYRDEYQAADRAHRIDNDRKKYEVRYYWLNAHYPEAFLQALDPQARQTYFEVGTYDKVQHDNLRRQARIFHWIMDGIGSDQELDIWNRGFLKGKMPFLFDNGMVDENGPDAVQQGAGPAAPGVIGQDQGKTEEGARHRGTGIGTAPPPIEATDPTPAPGTPGPAAPGAPPGPITADMSMWDPGHERFAQEHGIDVSDLAHPQISAIRAEGQPQTDGGGSATPTPGQEQPAPADAGGVEAGNLMAPFDLPVTAETLRQPEMWQRMLARFLQPPQPIQAEELHTILAQPITGQAHVAVYEWRAAGHHYLLRLLRAPRTPGHPWLDTHATTAAYLEIHTGGSDTLPTIHLLRPAGVGSSVWEVYHRRHSPPAPLPLLLQPWWTTQAGQVDPHRESDLYQKVASTLPIRSWLGLWLSPIAKAPRAAQFACYDAGYQAVHQFFGAYPEGRWERVIAETTGQDVRFLNSALQLRLALRENYPILDHLRQALQSDPLVVAEALRLRLTDAHGRLNTTYTSTNVQQLVTFVTGQNVRFLKNALDVRRALLRAYPELPMLRTRWLNRGDQTPRQFLTATLGEDHAVLTDANIEAFTLFMSPSHWRNTLAPETSPPAPPEGPAAPGAGEQAPLKPRLPIIEGASDAAEERTPGIPGTQDSIQATPPAAPAPSGEDPGGPALGAGPSSTGIGQHPVGGRDFTEEEIRAFLESNSDVAQALPATSAQRRAWAEALEQALAAAEHPENAAHAVLEAVPTLRGHVAALARLLRSPPASVEIRHASELPSFLIGGRPAGAFTIRQGPKTILYVRDLSGLLHEGLEHVIFPPYPLIAPTQRHTLAFFAEGLLGGERVTINATGRDVTVIIPPRATEQIQAMSEDERRAFIAEYEEVLEELYEEKFPPRDRGFQPYAVGMAKALHGRVLALTETAATPANQSIDEDLMRALVPRVEALLRSQPGRPLTRRAIARALGATYQDVNHALSILGQEEPSAILAEVNLSDPDAPWKVYVPSRLPPAAPAEVKQPKPPITAVEGTRARIVFDRAVAALDAGDARAAITMLEGLLVLRAIRPIIERPHLFWPDRQELRRAMQFVQDMDAREGRGRGVFQGFQLAAFASAYGLQYDDAYRVTAEDLPFSAVHLDVSQEEILEALTRAYQQAGVPALLERVREGFRSTGTIHRIYESHYEGIEVDFLVQRLKAVQETGVPALVAALQQEMDPRASLRMVWLLGQSRDPRATTPLVRKLDQLSASAPEAEEVDEAIWSGRLLFDENPRYLGDDWLAIRYLVDALKEIGDPRTAGMIRPLLDYPAAAAVVAASEALVALGDTSAISVLAAIATDPDRHSDQNIIRAAAIRALGELLDDAAVPSLRQVVEIEIEASYTPGRDLLALALTALWKLQSDSSRTALRELLKADPQQRILRHIAFRVSEYDVSRVELEMVKGLFALAGRDAVFSTEFQDPTQPLERFEDGTPVSFLEWGAIPLWGYPPEAGHIPQTPEGARLLQWDLLANRADATVIARRLPNGNFRIMRLTDQPDAVAWFGALVQLVINTRGAGSRLNALTIADAYGLNSAWVPVMEAALETRTAPVADRRYLALDVHGSYVVQDSLRMPPPSGPAAPGVPPTTHPRDPTTGWGGGWFNRELDRVDSWLMAGQLEQARDELARVQRVLAAFEEEIKRTNDAPDLQGFATRYGIQDAAFVEDPFASPQDDFSTATARASRLARALERPTPPPPPAALPAPRQQAGQAGAGGVAKREPSPILPTENTEPVPIPRRESPPESDEEMIARLRARLAAPMERGSGWLRISATPQDAYKFHQRWTSTTPGEFTVEFGGRTHRFPVRVWEKMAAWLNASPTAERMGYFLAQLSDEGTMNILDFIPLGTFVQDSEISPGNAQRDPLATQTSDSDFRRWMGVAASEALDMSLEQQAALRVPAIAPGRMDLDIIEVHSHPPTSAYPLGPSQGDQKGLAFGSRPEPRGAVSPPSPRIDYKFVYSLARQLGYFFDATQVVEVAAPTPPIDSKGTLGRCVTGDTLLPIRREVKGGRRKVEDVPIVEVQAGDHVLSLNEATGRLEWRRITGLLAMGTRRVYRLTTASGKTIRTTGNHPYLTRTGWRQVRTLAVGEEIAVARGLQSDGSGRPEDQMWNPREVAVRRGQVPHSETPQTGDGDGVVHQQAQLVGNQHRLMPQRWRERDDLQGQVRQALEDQPGVREAAHESRMAFQELDRMPSAFGMTGDGFRDQQPVGDFTEDRRGGHALKQARFDSTKQAAAPWRVVPAVVEEDVGVDKEPLPVREGVEPHLRVPDTQIGILGQALGKTSGHLHDAARGIGPRRRAQVGADGLALSQGQPLAGRKDPVAFIGQSGRLEGHGVSRDHDPRALEARLAMADLGVHRDVLLDQVHGILPYSSVSHGPQGLSSAPGRPAPQSEIRWDRIIAIEPLPPEPVYDIEVEGTHNFLANGLVVHNSNLGPAVLASGVSPDAGGTPPGEDPEGPAPGAPVSPPPPPPQPGVSGTSDTASHVEATEDDGSTVKAEDAVERVNRIGKVVGDIDDASRAP